MPQSPQAYLWFGSGLAPDLPRIVPGSGPGSGPGRNSVMFIVMLHVEVRHTHIEVGGEVNSSHMCKVLSNVSKSEKM